MKQKEHLPIFGVGPLCVGFMAAFLLTGLLLWHFGCLESGSAQGLRPAFQVLGTALLLLGGYIWIQAVLVSKIDRAILDNHLITTGIYSWVRNPIYSAIAIMLTGVSLLFANFWLLILPLLFWLDITLLMKVTEEKWLSAAYGQEYAFYCRRVNRCIPWPPRK